MWYIRQGRERWWNTLSEQERSRNAFSSAVIVRSTAPALANGPK